MTSDFFTKCLNLGCYIMKHWSLSKSPILANISDTMLMEGRRGHCLIFTTQFSLAWRGKGEEEGFLITAGWRWKFRLPLKPPYWYHPGWDQQGCLITTPHVTSADTMGRGAHDYAGEETNPRSALGLLRFHPSGSAETHYYCWVKIESKLPTQPLPRSEL